MPGNQLIELAAAGNILVLEAGGASLAYRTQRLAHDLFVYRRQFLAHTGEEAADSGESLRDIGCAAGAENQRSALAGQTVIAFGAETSATHRPEFIAEMLLDERNFRLERALDVAQAGIRSVVGRDAGENPGATFLVHVRARAIYWVHEDAHLGVIGGAATRQHQSPLAKAGVVQPLSNQHQWAFGRNFVLEEGHQPLLAHPVNGENGIRRLFAVILDSRQRLAAGLFRLRHHGPPDIIM